MNARQIEGCIRRKDVERGHQGGWRAHACEGVRIRVDLHRDLGCDGDPDLRRYFMIVISIPVYFAGKMITAGKANFGQAMGATLGGGLVYIVFYGVAFFLGSLLLMSNVS